VNKLHTFRGEASLFTWLCTICRHEIAAWLVRQRQPRMLSSWRSSAKRRGTVSASYVSATVEGPLGTSGRGSWIASVRNSHRDWPVRYNGEYEGTALGYTDAHAKLVYDVIPGQQFCFALLGGRAGIDERDNLGAQELGDGMNRAGLATLAGARRSAEASCSRSARLS
jgi:hypothetical protein